LPCPSGWGIIKARSYKKMSEELFDIQPEKVTLKIKGKEREIRFAFSSWAKLEQAYNGLSNLDKILKDLDEIPYTTILKVLWFGIVDKEGLDAETYLDEYTIKDVPYITEVFNKAIFGSLPKADNSKKEVEA
jgi:hypothetical protein